MASESSVTRLNPNGIPAQSPGLRGTSYLGKVGPVMANSNGVAAWHRAP